MTTRVGFYCWAGPGTIRMINLKYFHPPMDTKGILKSYEYEYLSEVREKLRVTDFWATYSWGFSDKTEKEDRQFLLSRVSNFKKLGMKLHAYIQGPNLVFDEFLQKDWFCRDEKNRLIPYHRGRKIVCLRHPGYQDYMRRKIQTLYATGVDGVYIDNIQMGQLGIVAGNSNIPILFTGCYCVYCQRDFKKEYGESIPTDPLVNATITKLHLEFRTKTVSTFLTDLSHVAHQGNMVFGTNSYDPKFNLKTILGVDLSSIDTIQDYIFFENHSLPNKKGTSNNGYLENVIKNFKKPVFVVSYRNGIGN